MSDRSQLLISVFMLVILGLVTIYASSSVPAAEVYGDDLFFLRKQAVTAFVGFLIIFLVGHFPIQSLPKLTLPLLIVTIALLALVVFSPLGAKRGGAVRWLVVFGQSFQPAELAKLALVFFLARNLSRPQSNLEDWFVVLPNLAICAGFAALLLIQPDFGTVALMSGMVMSMLFAAGISWRKLAIIGSTGVIGLVAAAITSPYRMQRLMSFWDPWAQVQGSGFQIIQSLLGYQNGGFFGLGLGESRQKLFFLPEAHNDFIMAVLGEELGLLGVSLICAIYAYIAYLGARIALNQANRYHSLLAIGITFMITSQALVNIGVSMGVLPTKGTALPFVSSGSSALLVFMLSISVLARLAQGEPKAELDTASP